VRARAQQSAIRYQCRRVGAVDIPIKHWVASLRVSRSRSTRGRDGFASERGRTADENVAPGQALTPGRGRHATTPVHIPLQGWKDILWRTYEQVVEDRLLAVAAGVVFYGLLALLVLTRNDEPMWRSRTLRGPYLIVSSFRNCAKSAWAGVSRSTERISITRPTS
jgi:hypothetical protein